MAWETTYLLFPILLLLLASGSWAQDIEMLQTLEGKNISVTCWYNPSHRFKEKVWCQNTRDTCKILASSLNMRAQRPQQYSIRDYPEFGSFTVTMTALKTGNSGLYWCGIVQGNRWISAVRTIWLVVSKASTPPTTSWMTTALATTTSPDNGSPPDNSLWNGIVAGVAVAVLLLLGLVLLVVLYLRKTGRRAQEDQKECHHIYEDFSGTKEETTGFDQQTLSNEEAGTICYASLIHLNHVNPQDSIYSNTQPCWKPSPDPFLSVEYASISRNRLQSSKSDALEVETRN